ncbi:MAG: UvrD-helicase domain-containing protein [Clostridia bacterium]|nr:UvrD-helicase domain-containing protein [Clostridia bacterium]
MTNSEFILFRKEYLNNYYSHLNDMQRKAVFSTEGPLLVLAGAGSGKTTVLVNRIANLIKFGNAYNDTSEYKISDFENKMLSSLTINDDIPFDLDHFFSVNSAKPWQILAITFTNKAAAEMKLRLSNMLGNQADDIWASTFHSACVRILRRNASLLGFSSNFTIYDTDDTKRVLKDCFKSLGISDKNIAIKTVINEISNAKNFLLDPDTYIKHNESDYLKNNIGHIYKLYREKLIASDAMDFDDIIFFTVKLFQQFPEVLEHYQNQFRYILVDEYQDTNHLQYLLVTLLAAKYRNICVVGDDDQSIYNFRGATIENILNFEDDYPDCKVIRLEQNYRSTQNILDAANAVISNNINRKGKNLWTDNGKGDLITYYRAESDRDEANYIAENIIKNKNKNFSDYAVLYRMNSQSNLIEQAFVRRGISYRIIGGHKFYDRKEIKDALAYLSVIVNKNDTVRLGRIINEPKRGIGDASFLSATEISEALEIGIFEVLENAEEYPKLSRVSKKIKEFTDMITELSEFAEDHSMSELLKEILDKTGYIASLDNEPERKEDRLSNLDQLLNNMNTYQEENEGAALTDFLQEISLMTDIDNYNSEADAVVMMTIHSAKGLEFPVVFLVGMEEGIFPSEMSLSEGDRGVEEERRLAYVAITRAKKKLYITNCKARLLYGMTRFNPDSRFINEIPESLIDNENSLKPDSYNIRTEQYKQEKTKSKDFGFSGIPKKKTNLNVNYKVGDTVIHKSMGEGVILSVKPMGNDCLLEVAFIEGQTKKLMANYANLIKK